MKMMLIPAVLVLLSWSYSSVDKGSLMENANNWVLVEDLPTLETVVKDAFKTIEDSSKIQYLGKFQFIEVKGEDSVYGEVLELWRSNGIIVGTITIYKGAPEPIGKGLITGGRYIMDELWFEGVFKSPHKTNSEVVYLDGILDSGLSGDFYQYSAKESIADPIKKEWKEQASFGTSKFDNFKAWKEAYATLIEDNLGSK